MRSNKGGGMDKRYGRRILSPGETEGLKRELATIEADRGGIAEGVPHRMQGFIDQDVKMDAGIMDARERKIRRVLADGSPEPLTGEARAKLEADEKSLRARLVAKMLNRKMMSLKPGTMEFTKARNMLAQNEMSAEFNRDASMWKHIRRQLDPADPDIANLENIRPD